MVDGIGTYNPVVSSDVWFMVESNSVEALTARVTDTI